AIQLTADSIVSRAPLGMSIAQTEKARITTDETVRTRQLILAPRFSRSSVGPLLRSLRDTGASCSSGRSGRRSVPPNLLRSSGGGFGVPSGCSVAIVCSLHAEHAAR